MSRESNVTRTVLLISGSTRAASSNTAFCRTAVDCAPSGIRASCYPDIATLPHFNPDNDRLPLPSAVAELRAAIEAADAVLFCTPEYAGTLPGSFKNLLDWTVGATVLTGKPVAWVKVAPDARRGEGAHSTLATVLGYVQAGVIPQACRHIPIPPAVVALSAATGGVIADPDVREAIAQTLRVLLDPDLDVPIGSTGTARSERPAQRM